MSRVLPILFNTDMIRAILDGRKTVTRRICKDGNDFTVPDMNFYDADKRTYAVHNYANQEHTEKLSLVERICPICPGDILYIRETWAQVRDVPHWGEYFRSVFPISPHEYIYKADNVKVDGILPEIKWHPSIHMPKDAARIWLKVTDVRVERLRDISAYDVLKEGVNNTKSNPAMGKRWENMQMMAFSELWDSTIQNSNINFYGWNANPWVWVIEFERCEKLEE